MKTKFSGFLTLLLVLAVQIGFAQTKTVTGNVTDADGLPLPGVNILVKGTNTGTQSDFDGKYSIKVSADQTLVFKYLGFKTQEIPVGSKSTVNVSMVVDAAELSEVVVTGYSTTTKTKSTVASQTISAKTIENRPNASFVQTLSGQVAGLNITTASGQPGANSTVNLRGVSSINGNTEPLFIIDGAPVDEDNFRSLNPQDIANITVLKDAGATAIYGNRGANGVIIIETRTGDYNSDLKINYTGIMSFNNLQDNDYDLMSSPEQLRLERLYGNGRGVGLTDEEINNTETFDWADFFFDAGLSENHTLSLSSGSANATQFTSFGLNETDGILQNSDLKRFNVRNNISGRSKNEKFKYSTNFSLNYSESNEPNEIGSGAINRNYILGAYQGVPYVTPDDYIDGADLVSQGTPFFNTPLYLLDRLRTYNRKEEEVKIIGSVTASYDITDDLTFRSVSSMDYQNEILLRSEGPESFNAILFAQDGNETPGFQTQSSRRVFTFNQLTSLNYSKTFGKHTIDGGLYTEYFKAHLRSFGYFAEGLNPKTFTPGDGAGLVGDNSANDFFVDDGFATVRNAGLFSYFANANYDYDETYGLGATIRRDASYRFTGDNTWATFFSVSGRWNINNEDFMDGVDFVDVLKLRASYGTAGNQRISGATYFSVPDLYRELYATGNGYAGQQSVFLGQLPNPFVQWETVATANLGVDFELFDSKLRGQIDVYQRETTDLFQNIPISAIQGTTGINSNTGSLFNRGVDVNLNYDLIRNPGDGLNLTLNFVGNYNKTELQDLPSEDGEIIGIGRNGGQLGEYYEVRYAGVNPANGNLLYYTADGNLTEEPNADTDRVWLDKNIIPLANGSFGFNVDYKGFFLQTQFNYVLGVDRFDFDLSGFQDPTSIGQFRSSRDLQRAWTPDNRVTDIPRLRAENLTLLGADESTRFIRQSDFLRLRFASFGYSIPKDVLEKTNTGISNVRLFVNGENLFTLSEWRGFDAEAQSNTGRLYPTPRTVSLGFEIGF
ncbi:SusC/RagA family TonB-linked outer membrane protein [Psychroflexus sp. ALD_RP9]|uniref:SusC/RagA family TonB-linked outer membrane protein n=1 Tax=Psychroflexus sp. ALD_RP9 TaxID=2777186 RepID=UPI001A8EE934|nr:SusC/RagA family TonB-linked outer membrane protein [Psychroflexus sp. ALD_RP9]QSS97755.1 SusC/RagA family TonB-linked outer membrane protein [Psychroflexus sp. ALD_RP9]